MGSCLHIATTLNNNLSETKIANEIIMSVQSLIILHLKTKSCLISCPARLGQTLDATDFSCAVPSFGQSREINTFVIDVESQ